ncbi:MAG: urate hydroxylase PuuD [Deltaproteobacteria bacterium]|nr:urate hydroxylase PuuD [Deltaproteobacteria bacterium]
MDLLSNLVSDQGFITFLFRWVHFFAGVTWIGLLYYFNFVQGSFFAETDAGTKNNCIQKLVPRALWWFRWGAMVTFITGVLIIGLKVHNFGAEVLTSGWGIMILPGAFLGTLMWANVWFVIWPNQKTVIQSATQTAHGGQPLPQAAAAGNRAGVCSRTNTMFSIPMLFFMGASSHFQAPVSMESNIGIALLGILAVLVVLELNALFGGLGPLKKVSGVITSGFLLTGGLYALLTAFL